MTFSSFPVHWFRGSTGGHQKPRCTTKQEKSILSAISTHWGYNINCVRPGVEHVNIIIEDMRMMGALVRQCPPNSISVLKIYIFLYTHYIYIIAQARLEAICRMQIIYIYVIHIIKMKSANSRHFFRQSSTDTQKKYKYSLIRQKNVCERASPS